MIVIFLSLALSSLQQSWFLVSVSHTVFMDPDLCFLFKYPGTDEHRTYARTNVFCDTGTQILLLTVTISLPLPSFCAGTNTVRNCNMLSWIKGLCGTKFWIIDCATGVARGNESSTNIKIFSCEVNHLKIIEQEQVLSDRKTSKNEDGHIRWFNLKRSW